MPATASDRFTPTAVGLVSRAWVIDEVERQVADPARHAVLIDDLVAYEPRRRHGLRNMFFFWASAIAASALARAAGLPPWSGFVLIVIVFAWLARLLATRALRWRLEQLIGTPPDARGDRP
jgi:hypothetical protein